MADNTDAPTAPIHDSIIDDLAVRYEVDRDALVEYLAVANDQWLKWESELMEHHEVVEDTDERLIVLASHNEETREMDKYAYSEVDIDIPDRHGSRANLLRDAHDRQARQYDYGVFGGQQAATDATAGADAIIIQRE
jgi:hypothetical protein